METVGLLAWSREVERNRRHDGRGFRRGATPVFTNLVDPPPETVGTDSLRSLRVDKHKLRTLILGVGIVVWQATPLSADQISNPETWHAAVSAAQLRAAEYRKKLKLEFERLKRDRATEKRHPLTERELALRASDQVMQDENLRHGDIVSTADGLLVFMGREGSSRSTADFVPYTEIPPHQ